MISHPYNSKIIDYYIRLVKQKYSHIHINELLKFADMKPYEVADQGHWFTQDQIDRFHEKLVQLTDNQHIAREAGRYAASPDSIGIMRQYVLGMVGPAHAFEIINKATLNFTQSSTYESRKISSNKFEIIVTPHTGVSEKPFQCENRIGFFEALVMVFGYSIPHIDHSACIFKGATSCRYTITWERSRSVTYKRIGAVISLLCIMLAVLLAVTGHVTILKNLLYLFVPVIFLLAAIIATSEKNELKASLDNTNESTDKLLEQIDSNYNNALLTNEIGQVLNSCTDSKGILALVIKIMEQRLDYDRGLILLANPDESRLVPLAGYGYSPEQRSLLDTVTFHLDRPESKGVFVLSFREQRPFLINDLNEIEENLSTHSLAFAKRMGTLSFICCPIISDGRSIGLLAVDNIKTKRALVESDISRMMGIASVIGISLRNVELIEAKVRQFNSVLQVLAASIDARDSMTAGHSEKVTEYSVGICNELGLPRDECEIIRVAALLHDYGKIGVPDAILKKEGKLTPEEYAIVMTHAEKTREILSRVNFEGMYATIPEIAAAHHEKIDGSGYPRGLTGPDIPLGSKIIAVADYFEAITTKRHYREPMPLDIAVTLLRSNSGTLFDTQIVEAFLSYYASNHPGGPAPADGQTSLSGIQQSPRVACYTRVSFKVEGKSSMAVSNDMSRHGIFIATDEDIAQGTFVELSITLSEDTPAIEVTGRIAWVNSPTAVRKPNFPSGFGVELLELKGISGRVLQSFLESATAMGSAQGDNRPAQRKHSVLQTTAA